MLGDVCEIRNNGFSFLRLIAAIGILAAHCLLVIPGHDASKTESGATVLFYFDLLLAVFFVFSGFLITASLERNQSLLRFTVARVLRIFPGLIVVGAMLAFVMGPMLTTQSFRDYFTSPQTWAFVPALSIYLDPTTSLPGVFDHTPVPQLVNMSIWTLRYEVIIYAAFPFAYLLFFTKGGWIRHGAVVSLFFIYLATRIIPAFQISHEALHILSNFSVSFLIGSALWLYRRWVPNSFLLVAVLWLCAFLLSSTSLAKLGGVFAAGYTFIWLAFWNDACLKFYNRFGDYSYGIYIIHFPIGQAFIFFDPDISSISLFFKTLLTTLVLAIALWKLVEKPSLSKVKDVEGYFNKRFDQFAALRPRTLK